MRTLKTIVAILIAIDMGTCPLIMAADGCSGTAASTISGAFCDLACTQECSGAWTINTPLWCKPSTGNDCVTKSFDPPLNLTIHHGLGTCSFVVDECKCVVPPGATWTDVQLTFWYTDTVTCPQG